MANINYLHNKLNITIHIRYVADFKLEVKINIAKFIINMTNDFVYDFVPIIILLCSKVLVL